MFVAFHPKSFLKKVFKGTDSLFLISSVSSNTSGQHRLVSRRHVLCTKPGPEEGHASPGLPLGLCCGQHWELLQEAQSLFSGWTAVWASLRTVGIGTANLTLHAPGGPGPGPPLVRSGFATFPASQEPHAEPSLPSPSLH